MILTHRTVDLLDSRFEVLSTFFLEKSLENGFDVRRIGSVGEGTSGLDKGMTSERLSTESMSER